MMTFHSQPKQEGGGGKDGVDLHGVNRVAILLKGTFALCWPVHISDLFLKKITVCNCFSQSHYLVCPTLALEG